ncbi:hypothetical protein C6A37_05075 [Desulfobacteraceae bacterium SEEP-SAG9]|nr:hypothetical protein C6A37_05075 [Desulfobacteraceae bacterium SEEP-SAG9]
MLFFISVVSLVVVITLLRDIFFHESFRTVSEFFIALLDYTSRYVSITVLIFSIILSAYYIFHLKGLRELTQKDKSRWFYFLLIFNIFANAIYYENLIVYKPTIPDKNLLKRFLKRSAEKISSMFFTPPKVGKSSDKG